MFAIAEKVKDDDELKAKVEEGADDGLFITDAGAKGRGICAEKSFSKGHFVCTYKGELINHREALKRCVS